MIEIDHSRSMGGSTAGTSRQGRDRDRWRDRHRPGDRAGARGRGRAGRRSPISTRRARKRAAAEIGRGASGIAIDVRKRDSVEQAFAAIERRLRRLRILCANAGVSTMNLVVDLTDEEWDFNFDVNARGVFLTNQAAVRHFLKTGTKGIIVNTASLAAKWGAPWLAHYSASKFAVMGFTQALAREVAANGIRVNCVCPGFVKTGMQSREVQWEAKLRSMTPQAGDRRIHRADAARPAGGAGGCRQGGAVPVQRSLRLHHRRVAERHRRRQDGLTRMKRLVRSCRPACRPGDVLRDDPAAAAVGGAGQPDRQADRLQDPAGDRHARADELRRRSSPTIPSPPGSSTA